MQAGLHPACMLNPISSDSGIPNLDSDQSHPALAVIAQDAIHRDARLEVLRNDVSLCEKNLRNRESAVGKAARADEAWRASWRAACSSCWLGAEAATAPVETVRAVLTAAAQLGPALDKRSDLASRIRDMENDQSAFSQEVGRLVAELGIETAGRLGPDLAKAIVDHVQEAARADIERKALQVALTEAQDSEREAQQSSRAHADRVDEMMRVLQAASLIEVAGKLRDIRDKAELEK